ncbi:MAG: hypothetical protein ISQ44_05125 [Cryomorphaceae bacterium]|nr:hypothetical protein [Cryomorphaceae bacterium]MBL6867103.1 hypothetical protein [Cryomorphaceae bacterium]
MNPLDGSTAVRYQYVNGDNDSEVEHYKVVDGCHDWPGTFGNMDIVSCWQTFYSYAGMDIY